MKFVHDFDDEHKKGFEVEVDKIRYDFTAVGLYSVRVIGIKKIPVWLDIRWFIYPNADENQD